VSPDVGHESLLLHSLELGFDAVFHLPAETLPVVAM
jgi:hypothetical protein